MIKFRAWSKKFKRMYEVTLIDYENGDVGLKDDHGGVAIGDIKQLILMQSTGLFDKNGKEIFEGDVVKCCRLFNDSLSEYVGQVKFVDFGWNIVDKADTHDPFYNYKDGFPDEIREIEVIGNIYQNSDLLESVEE
ncbi:TPA: YopX family protein [Streptococcus agalactiae]